MSLETQGIIHGIIIKQPRSTISDCGTLYFYLNNGRGVGVTFFRDQISFKFTWMADQCFDIADWNPNALYKTSSYNGIIGFYVPGDGYLYIEVVPMNKGKQSKSYKVELPEGEQYFNGKCHENDLVCEIGLYQ